MAVFDWQNVLSRWCECIYFKNMSKYAYKFFIIVLKINVYMNMHTPVHISLKNVILLSVSVEIRTENCYSK